MAKRKTTDPAPLAIEVRAPGLDAEERAAMKAEGVRVGSKHDGLAWLQEMYALDMIDSGAISATLDRLRLVGRAELWLALDRDSGYSVTVTAAGSLLSRVLAAWTSACEQDAGAPFTEHTPVNGGDLVEALGPLVPEVRAWLEGKAS